MKKFVKYILTFAAIIFATMSCVEEHQPVQPGEPDVEGCQGVYFPAQSTAFVFEPTDPTEITISVARTQTAATINVPFTIVDEENVFQVSDIIFEAGQSETTITINFPDAEVGTKYSGSFILEGDEYVSKYSQNPIAIDFSVIREKWNELGWGTWFEDGNAGYFSFTEPESVTILQNDSNKNLYRVVMTNKNGEKLYTDKQDDYLEFRVLKPGDVVFGTKVTMNDLVAFNIFDSGFYNSNYPSSPIWFVHPGSFSNLAAESNWTHNRVLQYQADGKTPAGVQLAPYYYINGVGGWNQTQEDGAITIIFPGAVLTDYSIAVETEEAVDGALPVNFTTGKDVTKVKYACYEGSLNVAQISREVNSIISGDTQSQVVAPVENEDGTFGASVSVEFDQTGVYTLVAVSYSGQDGEDSKAVAQQSASTSFGYLAAADVDDENYQVVVNAGLTVTDKYAPQGYSSENSLEFYIYGKDLTKVQYGLFTGADLANPQALLEELYSSDPVDEETLEAINGEGYSDLFVKLQTGTEYILVVNASNGYQSTLIVKSATTNGDPIPLNMDYTADHIFGYEQPETKDGFFGTYNYYAADFLGDDETQRIALGTVTITNSDTPSLPADEDGYITEYININGLFGAEADYFGWEDKMEWSVYGGYIFNTAESQLVGRSTSGYYMRYFVLASAAGSIFKDHGDMLIGGFVEDGHIAFASSELYNSGTLGEDGLLLRAFSDEGYTALAGNVAAYTKFLLVDPAKDVTPDHLKAANAKASSALALKKAIERAPANYVLTREAHIRSIIDKHNSVKNVTSHQGGFDFVTPDVKSVEFNSEIINFDPTSKKTLDHNFIQSVDELIIR